MNLKQTLKFFDTSQTALALSLEVTQPAVSNWGRRNYIPEEQQLKIREMSKGVLKITKRPKPPASPL